MRSFSYPKIILMKKNIFLGIAVFCSLMAQGAQSKTETSTLKNTVLEEVVLIDSRLPLKRSQSGKTVIQINAKEIQQFQGRSVAELLQTYGGINILGSRSITGQNLRFSLRGSTNNQVLIMVDGVRISDPSRIDSDFDLNFLSLSEISSIEILKGSASTLYGSAAAAGVINIKTKQGANDQLDVGFTVGSEQVSTRDLDLLSYKNAEMSAAKQLGAVSVNIGGAFLQTNGMSAVANGDEVDPFQRYNVFAKVGQKTAAYRWSIMARKAEIESEYDNVFPIEDANFTSFSTLTSVGLNAGKEYKNGSLSLMSAYQHTAREYRDNYPSAYTAENSTIELLNNLKISDQWYTNQGVMHNTARYEGAEVTSQTDVFAQFVYLGDHFQFNAGGRLNQHQTYGSAFTYNINPSYVLTVEKGKHKVFGSVSSAFIAPSLFQLYDTYSGNDTLNPETNTSREIGWEYSSFDNTRFSMLYFSRDEQTSIVYDFATYAYANAESSLLYDGVEAEFEFAPQEDYRLRFNYTFNQINEGNIARIPKHAYSFVYDYKINETLSYNISFNHIGKRFAYEGTPLAAYDLLDLKLNKSFYDDALSVFVLMNNALNTAYIELLNYATQGRNYRLGLRYRF